MSKQPPLPQKEQYVFKRLIRCYEQKQYKNGLKAARLILQQPQFADHGETLAMKGLILNSLNRKEEAYEHVRRGLKNHLVSHVCWHVYGLLYRSDRNYDQAIKCYQNALKYDPENLQILRDLSMLQVQMRDYDGYKTSRYGLLGLRPQQRASWLSLAIAHQIAGEHDEAVQVLDMYDETTAKAVLVEPQSPIEASEQILYKAMVLAEAGKPEAALALLADKENKIVDKRVLRETRASLYLAANQIDKALELYNKLLKENPENKNYYIGLEKASGITEQSSEEARYAVYAAAQERFPRAQAPKRLPLAFTTGVLFERLLVEYIRPGLRKGVIPLFRVLRPLYKDAAKVAFIEKTVLGFLDSLKSCGKLSAADAESESPVVIIWVYLYLAQHFDHLGHHQRALDLVNTAIDYTPTVLELYIVKAKIYKHAGNAAEAAKWLDYARELDTADRYINSRAVKYLLAAGEIQRAEEVASFFTREGPNDVTKQLFDMQCYWFETAEANAYLAKGETGKGLKKLAQIEEHFAQVVDDQFDFHTYCMRKMTLRSYIAMLRMEDRIREHKYYERAALVAAKAYVALFDNPPLTEEKKEEQLLAAMSEADRKKYLSKQKKAAVKKAAEMTQAKPLDEKELKAKKEAEEIEKLGRPEKPLEEAIKFLRPLLVATNRNIDVHAAAIEVYVRAGKLLLALQALKRAAAIDASHPAVHAGIVRLLHAAKTATLAAPVKAALDTELAGLSKEKDAEAALKAHLAANSASVTHVLGAATAAVTVTPASLPTYLAALAATTPKVSELRAATDALAFLGENKAEAALVDKFKGACRAVFPLASAFAQ